MIGSGDVTEQQKLFVKELLDFYHSFLLNEEYLKKAPNQRELVTITICLRVINRYLGQDWVLKNLAPDTGRGFMKLKLDQSEEAEIKAARVWDLAELLLNLSHIRGFAQLAERMKTAETESSLAELHVGRILYINDVSFRFVVPSGKQGGDNFDMEIIYPDGLQVCGETKCKIESTQLTSGTIDSALRKARSQLPADRPGIIFVKFPQSWFEAAEKKRTAERTMVETAWSFFKGEAPKIPASTRIVSIVYYAEPLTWESGIVKQGHLYKEVPNPGNKFDTARDWTLLHYLPITDYWDKLPEKWIRLVNFPDELRKHRN